MKNSNRITRVDIRQIFSPLAVACLALWPGVNSLRAAAPPATTTIRYTSTDFEGRSTYRLEWDAESNLVYRIQARAGLETNAAWTAYDLVRATGPRASFEVSTEQGVSPEAGAQGFFQVLQPQPEIERVEPALLGPNGGTLYVFGQCFGTNLSLRLGTLVLPPNPLQPGAPYSFTIASGALATGIYDVEILDGTNVLARAEKLFTVTGEPSPVGESAGGYARLLEPPSEPPGSPEISASLLMPALMKAKEKANRTKAQHRTMPNGELQLCEVDFTIPGRGLDFVWARTYRSRTGTNTVMGQGWSHSYDIRCFTGPSSVTIQDGTGRHDTYQGETNGYFMADELFNVGVFTNDQFVLRFPDGGRWEFVPTNAVNAGRVSRIVDRNDNALTFTYSPGGQLLAIVDTLGNEHLFGYTATGRIRTIRDFSGRSWSYTYWRQGDPGGGDGDLRSVTTPPVVGTINTNDFPNGKTTTYTYSKDFPDNRLNHNLLTITDALGQEWLHITYKDEFDPGSVDFDRVASVQRGANPPSMFTYVPQTPAPENRWAVLKTMENDPVGNVTIDWFDSLNRCVIHRDLAARAVPGELLIDGKLPTENLREGDPEFWETTFEWNVDSLCTVVTYPRGNRTETVHNRSQDHNSSRSNKTNTRHNDGNPIVVREVACCMENDEDILTTRLTYDARFGSPAGHMMLFDDTEGKEKFSFHNGPRQTTARGTGPNGQGLRSFATSTTDPRGLRTTAQYDAKGNVLVLAHQGRLLDASDAPVTNFEYDPHGQLLAVVHPLDANGERRRDEFTYLNACLHTWAVDTTKPDTTLTRYGRDAVGNMTELVDPNGNTNQFIYNALDQLMRSSSIIHCTACSAITRDFFYDANDNVVREEFSNHDFSGALDTNNPSWTTLYEYDPLNRRTLVAHEAAHVVQQRFATNRFVYDANDNVIEEHSPEAVKGNQPSNWIQHSYDTRDLLFTTTSAPGTADSSTDEFDYDPNGNLARSSRGGGGGAGGSIWLQSFDGFDRLATATDPLGNVQTFTYDANDNLLSERLDGQTNDVAGGAGNRRLSFTRYEYDGLDRTTARRMSWFDIFTEVNFADGDSTTTWAYAPDGALRRVTDDNGHATRYGYDSKGRLTTVTDAKTNLTSYLYDPNGNVLQVKQVDRSDAAVLSEFTRSFQYDELDRCVLEFDNVGNQEQYAYDSRGNLVRHLDARSVLYGWQHDGLGNITVAQGDVNGDGTWDIFNDHFTYSQFDDNSRLIAATDANTNITRYAYDALDRLIATTNADGTVHRLIWSPRSNLVRTEDANGTVVSNSFDLLDRCVRRDITPGGGVLPTTTFELFAYDGASQLVLASNDVSMVEFSRNSLGVIEKGKQDCIAVAATFDGEGNRLSLTYPTGGVVHFTYDPLDQVSTVSRTYGGQTRTLATFAYEGAGRLGRMTRTNGINTRLSWNGTKNPPNAQGDSGWGQVSSVNHQFAGGGATIDRRIAAYDPNQNKILRQQTVPFATGVPALTTNVFGYDALNRMTSFSRNRASTANTKSLSLDKQGNRQSVSSNGVVELYTMDSGTPEPADFQMNQYTITPFGAQQHDHNGNLVSVTSPAGVTFYSYDYADQLVLVQRTGAGGLETVAQFSYDALGRRISKSVFPPAPALPVTTCFLLDPDTDDILEEWDNSVPRLFAVWPHMHQVGHARIGSSGETHWVHTDETGTALALTDDAGLVLERYDYREAGEPMFFDAAGVPMVDAFGQAVRSSPLGNHFLFNGMFWDGETGLYLDGSIYHNPLTGKPLTHVHGDPHVDQKDGTRWDFSRGGGGGGGAGGMRAGISTSRSNIRNKSSFHGGGGGGSKAQDHNSSRSNKTASSIDQGGGGGAGGFSIGEPGVQIASPRDAASGLPTGRRSSAPRDAASGQATGKRISSPRDSASGLATGKRVSSPRDPASGLATGKRITSPRDPASGQATGKRVSSPRDPATGQASGRRSHVQGHFALDLDGKRDSASGLPTGRRLHAPRDSASGLATGKRAPRDAASGQATGKRAPRDPATGLSTGRRLYGPGQAHWGSAKLMPQTYKATQGKSGRAKNAL